MQADTRLGVSDDSSAPSGHSEVIARFLFSGVSVVSSSIPEHGRSVLLGLLPTLCMIVIACVVEVAARSSSSLFSDSMAYALSVLVVGLIPVIYDLLACVHWIRVTHTSTTRAALVDRPLRLISAVCNVALFPYAIYEVSRAFVDGTRTGQAVCGVLLLLASLLSVLVRDHANSSLLPHGAVSSRSHGTISSLRLVTAASAIALARRDTAGYCVSAGVLGCYFVYHVVSRPFTLRVSNFLVSGGLLGAAVLSGVLGVDITALTDGSSKATIFLALSGAGGLLLGILFDFSLTRKDISIGRACFEPISACADMENARESVNDLIHSNSVATSFCVLDTDEVTSRVLSGEFRGAKVMLRRPVSVLSTFAAHCIREGEFGIAEAALRAAGSLHMRGRSVQVNTMNTRPSSAFGARLLLTSLLLQLDDSVTRGIVELKRLERTQEASIGLRMATMALRAYADKKRRAQSIGTAAGAGVDLQAVVSNLELAKRYHRQAIATQVRVWSLIARRKLKYQQAHDAAADASKTIIKAEASYKHVLERLSYRRPEVLHLYALFLADIKKDTAAAARLRDEAEKAECIEQSQGALAHSMAGSSLNSSGSGGSTDSEGSTFATESLADIRSGRRSIKISTFSLLTTLAIIAAAALSVLFFVTSLVTVPLATLTGDIASTLSARVRFSSSAARVSTAFNLEVIDAIEKKALSTKTAVAAFNPFGVVSSYDDRLNRSKVLTEEMSILSTALYHGDSELHILDSDNVGTAAFYQMDTPRTMPVHSVSANVLPSQMEVEMMLFKDFTSGIVGQQRSAIALLGELRDALATSPATTTGIDKIYTAAFGATARQAYGTAVDGETVSAFVVNWLVGSSGMIDSALGGEISNMQALLLSVVTCVVCAAILCLAFAYSIGFRDFHVSVVSRGWSALSLVAYADRISVLNVKRAAMSRFVTFERSMNEGDMGPESSSVVASEYTDAQQSFASFSGAIELPEDPEYESTSDNSIDMVHDNPSTNPSTLTMSDSFQVKAVTSPHLSAAGRRPALRFAAEDQQIAFSESGAPTECSDGDITRSEVGSEMSGVSSSSSESSNGFIGVRQGKRVLTSTATRLKMTRKISMIRLLGLISLAVAAFAGVYLIGFTQNDLKASADELLATPTTFLNGWEVQTMLALPLSHIALSPVFFNIANKGYILETLAKVTPALMSDAAALDQMRLQYGQESSTALESLTNGFNFVYQVYAPWRSLAVSLAQDGGVALSDGLVQFGAAEYDITAESWTSDAGSALSVSPLWRDDAGSLVWYSTRTADLGKLTADRQKLLDVFVGDPYSVDIRSAITANYVDFSLHFGAAFSSSLEERHVAVLDDLKTVEIMTAVVLAALCIWYVCILVSVGLTKSRLGVPQSTGMLVYAVITPVLVIAGIIVLLVYINSTNSVSNEFEDFEVDLFNDQSAIYTMTTSSLRLMSSTTNLLHGLSVAPEKAFVPQDMLAAASEFTDVATAYNIVKVERNINDRARTALVNAVCHTLGALSVVEAAAVTDGVNTPLAELLLEDAPVSSALSILETIADEDCATIARTNMGADTTGATKAVATAALKTLIQTYGGFGLIMEEVLKITSDNVAGLRSAFDSPLSTHDSAIFLAVVIVVFCLIILVLPINVLLRWRDITNSWMRSIKAPRVDTATKAFVVGILGAMVITGCVVGAAIIWSLSFKSKANDLAHIAAYPVLINAATLTAVQASSKSRYWSPTHHDRLRKIQSFMDTVNSHWHAEGFRNIPAVKRALALTSPSDHCISLDDEICQKYDTFYTTHVEKDATAVLIHDSIYGSADGLITTFQDIVDRRTELLGSDTSPVFDSPPDDGDLQILIALGNAASSFIEETFNEVVADIRKDTDGSRTVQILIISSSVAIVIVILCVITYVLGCLRNEAHALFSTMLDVPLQAIMRVPLVSEFVVTTLKL